MFFRRFTCLSLLLVALAAGGPLAAQNLKPACSTGIIQTSSGPVCGLAGSGPSPVSAYLGIPYAVPPTGPLRWQSSKPFPESAGTLPATAFADECPQSVTVPTGSAASGSRCTDGKVLGPGQSEDCLYLNVWVPGGTTADSSLPVLVFIHGGAFVTGSGSGGDPSQGHFFDGSKLAALGQVIVVTFNYRLGALGFLARNGNYNFGFSDQLLALNWVKTNIDRFGGDHRNVTLFGESAGAMSVGLHVLSSPQSSGLFQAGIMESNLLGLRYKSTSEALAQSDAFCSGGSSLCGTETSTCDLVEAQGRFMETQSVRFLKTPDLLTWTPVVDFVYVTGQPIASAGKLGMPLILGTNRDEGTAFVYGRENQAPDPDPLNPPVYAKLLDQIFGRPDSERIRSFERYRCGASQDCGAQLANVLSDHMFTCANRWFAMQASRGAAPQPLYLYQFNQVSSFNFWSSPPLPPAMNVPQCKGMVCHADELPYVFDTAGQIGQTFSDPEKSLARTIGKHWTDFARNQNPGSAWPAFAFGRSYRLLNESPSTASDPLNAVANCSSLWDDIGYARSPRESKTPAPKNDFIVHGGDIVTLDEAGTLAEAVWVRDGRIEAVGTREEVMRHATKTTELIDLHGGALLPGFVEPHVHLDFITYMSFFTDLSPCLPAPYRTEPCSENLFDALKTLELQPPLPGSDWRVGFGVDPSLMDSAKLSSVDFHANPASYIGQYVSETQPVIILDKSGHLAYANLQAFVAAGICSSVTNCGPRTALKPLPPLPGQWIVGPDGLFTGLITEQQAYVDFVAVIPQPTPEAFLDRAESGARMFAQAGLTTMINAGTTNGPLGANLFPALASRTPAQPLLRYRALTPCLPPCDPSTFPPGPTPWDESFEGLFGITGIKLWVDGSAQGCTAALVDPYNKNGLCGSAGRWTASYTPQQIRCILEPFWEAGWPIQMHVNGDQAILNALDALALLQMETRNDSPITLLHFTVDGNPATGEDLIQRVADLRAGRYVYKGKPVPPVDVSVSHLIAHIAYWGGAFQGILDGVRGPGHPDERGRAARLDATRHELELGVPFSLHSDVPVSPVQPLWYVEQAVTRNTWFYPDLDHPYTMPGDQGITIEQALRAVTLEPARQNRLDRYIGSIEKGKIADLVILDKNPLKQRPEEIHQIRVLSTFVGGYRNDFTPQPECDTRIVPTTSGPVCGMTTKAPLAGGLTASAYLGIPYAKPPIGPRRWQYPTLFEGSGLLRATSYGNACPQSLTAGSASSTPDNQCTDGRALQPGQSEDCLYLNVWVPGGTTAGSRLPVMVFIHGGSFVSGSGSAGAPVGNLYEGTYLAATGKVILVTFNYRLGALGFLAHDGKHNFGFADQLLALDWVRKNIEGFGGDPHNVTLFGESAGAKSVGLHALASPRSAGLFQAAIMESNALGLPYKDITQAERLKNELCAGDPSLCTDAASACDLVEAQDNYLATQPLSFAAISNFMWSPTVDDVYITGQPIASAGNLRVPLMLGTNHDEGTVFVYQAEALAPKSNQGNPPDSAAYAKILDGQFGPTRSERIRSVERYRCDASPDCTAQLVNVMADYAFTCANRHLAIEAARSAEPYPLHIYQFDQVSSFNFWANVPPKVPQCAGRVCHADELPYVFNTAWQFPQSISFTPAEEALSQTIGESWTNFARGRNPGNSWPPFGPGRTYLLLSESSSTADDPLNASSNCSTLWDGIGYGRSLTP